MSVVGEPPSLRCLLQRPKCTQSFVSLPTLCICWMFPNLRYKMEQQPGLCESDLEAWTLDTVLKNSLVERELGLGTCGSLTVTLKVFIFFLPVRSR